MAVHVRGASHRFRVRDRTQGMRLGFRVRTCLRFRGCLSIPVEQLRSLRDPNPCIASHKDVAPFEKHGYQSRFGDGRDRYVDHPVFHRRH